MNSKTKKIILSTLAYMLVFMVISQGVSWWKSRDAPTGDLSELKIELMDGSQFLLSRFSGQPVLLHFWATWCPICDFEKDSVQSISQDYPVISVASWSEGEAEVRQYMQTNQLNFPVMLDNEGQMASSFGLQGVPVSFILSPGGEIVHVETGYVTEIGLRFRLWLASVSE